MQINEDIPTVLMEGETYCAEYTMKDVDKVCKDLKVKKASGRDQVLSGTLEIWRPDTMSTVNSYCKLHK